mmetsp:Transcript_10134/g.31944  ORF Transcript_10134/g.31944 Transcript_10134/m.31944 type:complete len:151 (+) Transcript_10134:97-549(+)
MHRSFTSTASQEHTQSPNYRNTASSKAMRSSSDEKTTLMICNIPQEVANSEVVNLIDRLGFHQKYDMIHLTSGGNTSVRNYRYGFINLRSAQDAEAFTMALSGLRFEGATNSQNGVSIRPARVQGLLASLRLLAESEQQHGLTGFVCCWV